MNKIEKLKEISKAGTIGPIYQALNKYKDVVLNSKNTGHLVIEPNLPYDAKKIEAMWNNFDALIAIADTAKNLIERQSDYQAKWALEELDEALKAFEEIE